jgi:hypothetical protein
MSADLQLGDIAIEVVREDTKNVHLSVHPPDGHVRISTPRHLSTEALRAFAISQLGWIRQEQRRLREQARESPREHLDREPHYVWGRPCLLGIVERTAPPAVEWRQERLILSVWPGTGAARRAELLETWYREQVRAAGEALLPAWQETLGVRAERLYVRRMRTRWGSCNPATRTVRLNTVLATKPAECLEYILVHELLHLLEPSHNARFVALMDAHLPDWRHRGELLNSLPLRPVNWNY